MNQALANDLEQESSGGGLLAFLGRAADIYSRATGTGAPASAAPASPTPRVVQTPVGSFSPLAIGGAVVALVLVLWLALRGK